MDKIFAAIFTPEFLFSVIRVSTPLILGSMAALICNRGGMLHIAFEGIMLSAAFFGMLTSAVTQSVLLGLLGAVAGGLLISMLLGYFNLVLNSDRTLTGIALNTFASAGTVFALYLLVQDKGTSSSLPSLVVPNIDIPLIKDIPVLGTILSGHNALTYAAFLIVFLTYVIIFRTPLGLRIRTVGENPNAAASVGINVLKIRFITLAISAVVASLAGAYMSMGYLSWFSRDMMAGRGFMSIAAQNLGAALPLPSLLASLAFGAVTALANVLQTLNMPSEIIQAMPYVATLIGLGFFGYGAQKSSQKRSKAVLEKARAAEGEKA
ncbi:MAG: ABC transporter permease [Lachnospiraceae bacterium]|nr:ABC transporter permease [Lachnospiraceae bacterium]